MTPAMRAFVSAALVLSAHVARAENGSGRADALVAKFAALCMADPSPHKSADEGATAARLIVDEGLSGTDMPNPSHIVATRTWHAGNLGGTPLSLVSTSVDSGKCRVEACGLVAERAREPGIEAALMARLRLPAPASRQEDNGGVQTAWPLKSPPGRVVTFAAQKSLAGDRVTLTVAQLCTQP